MGGENKQGGWRFFVKFNKQGVRISKYPLILVMNEKRNKCLILMFSLKVSKQTRSETSKNKVIIRRVSNISIN